MSIYNPQQAFFFDINNQRNSTNDSIAQARAGIVSILATIANIKGNWTNAMAALTPEQVATINYFLNIDPSNPITLASWQTLDDDRVPTT